MNNELEPLKTFYDLSWEDIAYREEQLRALYKVAIEFENEYDEKHFTELITLLSRYAQEKAAAEGVTLKGK